MNIGYNEMYIILSVIAIIVVILLNRTTPIFLWCLSMLLVARCSHICGESVVSARPILDSTPHRLSWPSSICTTWTLSTGEHLEINPNNT